MSFIHISHTTMRLEQRIRHVAKYSSYLIVLFFLMLANTDILPDTCTACVDIAFTSQCKNSL